MKDILFLLVVFLFMSCNQYGPRPEAEIKEEVTELFHKLYEDYSKSDVDRFSSFYHDSVLRMGTSGKYRIGKDKFVEGWKKTFETTEAVILDYSQPTVFVGQDQVVTFNTYDELFIDRTTRDTTRVQGTWIGVWKQQIDKSWKLVMTTWHQ